MFLSIVYLSLIFILPASLGKNLPLVSNFLALCMCRINPAAKVTSDRLRGQTPSEGFYFTNYAFVCPFPCKDAYGSATFEGEETQRQHEQKKKWFHEQEAEHEQSK